MNRVNIALIIIVVIAGISFFAVPEIIEIIERNNVESSIQKTIDSFDGRLSSVILTEGKYYSFVLDEDLEKILLHPRKELINKAPTGLTHANISIEEMKDRLEEYGSTWVDYTFYDPMTGDVEPKTTKLVIRSEYVFGAGYYSP